MQSLVPIDIVVVEIYHLQFVTWSHKTNFLLSLTVLLSLVPISTVGVKGW